MKNYCYKDGKIVPSDKAFVGIYDIGLLRGYGIYEGITTRNGKPFHLKEHLARFRKSAKKMNLKIPLKDRQIEKIIHALIQKNKFERTNIKMILTGGETLNSIGYNPAKPTFFIFTEEWHTLPHELYAKGGKLITYDYLRFMPEIKTTHYITAVQLQTRRQKQNAVEILYTSQNNILECSTSNIFIFKKDTLITPKNNVLPGITRKVVLEIAKRYFRIEERDVSFSELLKVEEVFITSSFKDIVPITTVDKTRIAKGTVGKNTKLIMELFSK